MSDVKDDVGDALLPFAMRAELRKVAEEKGVDYLWLVSIFHRGVNAEPGGTGHFPQGEPYHPEDQGEISVLFKADKEKQRIYMFFGKPLEWLVMPTAQAKALMTTLGLLIKDLGSP